MGYRKRTVAHDLAADAGLSWQDYRRTVRPRMYPLGRGTTVPVEAVAGVARALVESGLAPVRHAEDYERLCQALRWFVAGSTGGRQ